MTTRRHFLEQAPLGLAAAIAACRGHVTESQTPAPGAPTPGAPPTFGTAPGTGPQVAPATFEEAERLMQVTLTPAERTQAAGSWRKSLASQMERRTGPRKVPLPDTVTPATRWNPLLVAPEAGPKGDRFVRTPGDPGPLPDDDAAIAYAPVTRLSRWVESRKLTSERLTRIYLDRIARFDGRLRSVITLTRDHALTQARQADAEIASGKYRGPLHGIPFGVKDLLDTEGIRTTWGAEPYRDRVPAADAVVVRRLYDAGAVLLAKLSLGALALNDIWFGGQTMNPWLLEEGACARAAGPFLQ